MYKSVRLISVQLQRLSLFIDQTTPMTVLEIDREDHMTQSYLFVDPRSHETLAAPFEMIEISRVSCLLEYMYPLLRPQENNYYIEPVEFKRFLLKG